MEIVDIIDFLWVFSAFNMQQFSLSPFVCNLEQSFTHLGIKVNSEPTPIPGASPKWTSEIPCFVFSRKVQVSTREAFVLNLYVSEELVATLCSLLGRNKYHVSKSSRRIEEGKKIGVSEIQLKSERASEAKTMGLPNLYLAFLLTYDHKSRCLKKCRWGRNQCQSS